MAMARFLRDPDTAPPPAGVEARRLKIYQDLVYNNIEGFISSGFPVLRSLYTDSDWHALVRAFMQQHRCRSPYFLEISQEFLQFLMQDFQPRDCDPPFMTELAHYEWVELALDVSQETLPAPAPAPVTDIAAAIPALSPLAWVLAYRFPVHHIGAGRRPETAAGPTYLAVYRDRNDRVRFMEINAASARLLELVRDNDGATVLQLLDTLAAELGMDSDAVRSFGLAQVEQFAGESVLFVTEG